MSNLLIIDCNRGRKVDNGFRHSIYKRVFDLDKKPVAMLTHTVKFSEIIDASLIKTFREQPNEFLKELEDLAEVQDSEY